MVVSAGRNRTWLLQTFIKLLCLFSYACISSAVGSNDTISLGESLTANQTIISRERKFELGFKSPGNSGKYYICTWYYDDQTVVWMANRDMPISPTSLYNSSLVLPEDGHLVLFSGLDRPIWSTNSTIGTSSRATTAVLLDTGNFVLKDGEAVVWQSFDYPTDTLLPGGRVGVDKVTKRRQLLTSWKYSNDPSSGDFSYGVDQSGVAELFVWWKGSVRIWRSGVWNGEIFAGVPEMRLNYLFIFGYILNENASYFTFDVLKNTTISRYVLENDGTLVQMTKLDPSQPWTLFWRQVPPCGTSNSCGSFGVCNLTANATTCSCLPGFQPRFPTLWDTRNFSSGCVRINRLQCNKDKEGFLKIPNTRLPAGPKSLGVGTVESCELACSANCSCNAYAYNTSRGCSLWTGDLLDHEPFSDDDSAGDLHLKLNAFELPATGVKRRSKSKRPIIVVAVLLPLLICGFVICAYLWRRKFNRKGSNPSSQNLLALKLDISSITNTNGSTSRNKMAEEDQKALEFPTFSFSSITAATQNFSVANKLGEGGFGPVYKGNLLNGQSVAVKRLSKMSGQGLEEMINETKLIAKLQHKNLVRLLGCCIERDEKILIYEYMSNKSLDSFLFDPEKQHLLDWKQRVNIIEGTAQGILYLHQYSRLRIVHRDLKASNILLDDDMNPKISDFGMARIFGGNELHANTNRIVGTYGYMSPEYAMEGRFSVKSDVFAFGVLLLEIVSGKRSTGFQSADHPSLLGYAWMLWESDRLLELIDPMLQIPSSSFMPVRYIHVGLLCVQDSPADRPTISEIVAMLSNEQVTLVSPKRPAYAAGMYASSGKGESETCSANYYTTSVVEPR